MKDLYTEQISDKVLQGIEATVQQFRAHLLLAASMQCSGQVSAEVPWESGGIRVDRLEVSIKNAPLRKHR